MILIKSLRIKRACTVMDLKKFLMAAEENWKRIALTTTTKRREHFIM